ncbi:hypothetical protein PRIO_2028 [Paenibacillus riograndensis SBR5]|uniref:Uncharacterized protein n=1 Tax=Paenibacillus riograndensis SBR5 TaxID=1073571 RepID=A0A0E4H8R6_9BACL|nr:hypothetical protein PRIO_2028 [Paenibacillus riograndensis SBR5]
MSTIDVDAVYYKRCPTVTMTVGHLYLLQRYRLLFKSCSSCWLTAAFCLRTTRPLAQSTEPVLTQWSCSPCNMEIGPPPRRTPQQRQNCRCLAPLPRRTPATTANLPLFSPAATSNPATTAKPPLFGPAAASNPVTTAKLPLFAPAAASNPRNNGKTAVVWPAGR